MSSTTAFGDRTRSRTFSAPLGGAVAGELVFHGGASHITFDATRSMDDLFRATFTQRIPDVRTTNGRVDIQFPREYWPFNWLGHSHETPTADIVLNADIPWRLSIRGGASRVEGTLAALELDRFEVRGGASRMDLTLGRPRGTGEIVIQGGASRLTIARPGNVPVRISVAGGMSRVELDDQHFSALGGGVGVQTDGYVSATYRYLVDIHGGASRVTVSSSTANVRRDEGVIYL